MREKIANLTALAFLAIFCGSIFFVSNFANSQSQNFQSKSHLQFNKKFAGIGAVIDGDSIKVGKNEVRLFGLDAPEYSQTCFDATQNEYSCGKMSREFLVNFAQGKEIECIYAQMDKYNRFLSKCFVDKASINEAIIKNGMAVIYNFNESDQKMIELEKIAKEKKLGIWKGAFQLPRAYRKAHPRN